jgi:acylphosphatase
MTTVCARFVVSGRVQGVNFRAATRAAAKGLGVRGWVRNLPDGDVELLACGSPPAVDQLERWLWQGPPVARVSDVRRDAQPETEDRAGFDVVY